MATIRRLTEPDRAAFRTLRLLALTVSPDEFMMTAEEERDVPRPYIESALGVSGEAATSRATLFLGAFENGGLIAIGGLHSDDLRKTRHTGRITSLFVHPDHRRRGIARRLMEELLLEAMRTELQAVRLEVVSENSAAIGLYESLGFAAYGREPVAYKLGDREWDLLLMTRNVR
jgi:ribosomal protein S18 acetylase RimI-like enzyme